MNENPVIKNHVYCLAHVPDLVRYGSKPRREICKNESVEQSIREGLRSFEQAKRYPPNQVYVGNLPPEELATIPRPWYKAKLAETSERGKFGEVVSQYTFFERLKSADVITPPLFEFADEIADMADGSLPIYSKGTLRGYFHRDNRAEGREDENLSAVNLLENLCSKTSGGIALESLLEREELDPAKIDYIISCGEEACGDRYQRGGGGMAKAIGEMCGCVNASGMDVKNFCAAPASALITAGALVKAGVYERVAVVGGGSLAKLGMKFQAELQHQVPILDDCLASIAFLVTADDGQSPILRLEAGAVGLATIGSSTSDEAVYRRLMIDPLESLGLKLTDVDKFAPELHNAELMEFAGAGDVARKNYRTIAALAVLTKQLEKSQMNAFIDRIGMPGFAPTQGHIPSAVPYIGHAARAMKTARIHRAMFLCKASLFLNRITNLFDGVSFILEANPKLE